MATFFFFFLLFVFYSFSESDSESRKMSQFRYAAKNGRVDEIDALLHNCDVNDKDVNVRVVNVT